MNPISPIIANACKLIDEYVLSGDDKADILYARFQKIISEFNGVVSRFEYFLVKTRTFERLDEIFNEKIESIFESLILSQGASKDVRSEETVKELARIIKKKDISKNFFPDVRNFKVEKIQYKMLKKCFAKSSENKDVRDFFECCVYQLESMFEAVLAKMGPQDGGDTIALFYNLFIAQLEGPKKLDGAINFLQNYVIKTFVEVCDVPNGQAISKWVDSETDPNLLQYVTMIALVGFDLYHHDMAAVNDVFTFFGEIVNGKVNRDSTALQRKHLLFSAARVTDSSIDRVAYLTQYQYEYSVMIGFVNACMDYVRELGDQMVEDDLHDLLESVLDKYKDSPLLNDVIKQLKAVFNVYPWVIVDLVEARCAIDPSKRFSHLHDFLDYLLINKMRVAGILISGNKIELLSEIIAFEIFHKTIKLEVIPDAFWDGLYLISGTRVWGETGDYCPIARAGEVARLVVNFPVTQELLEQNSDHMDRIIEEGVHDEGYRKLVTEFEPLYQFLITTLYLAEPVVNGQRVGLVEFIKPLMDYLFQKRATDRIYDRHVKLVHKDAKVLSELIGIVANMKIPADEKFRFLLAAIDINYDPNGQGYLATIGKALDSIPDDLREDFRMDAPIGEERDFIQALVVAKDQLAVVNLEEFAKMKGVERSTFNGLKYLVVLHYLRKEKCSESFSKAMLSLLSLMGAFKQPFYSSAENKQTFMGAVLQIVNIHRKLGSDVLNGNRDNPVIRFMEKIHTQEEVSDGVWYSFFRILATLAIHSYSQHQVHQVFTLLSEHFDLVCQAQLTQDEISLFSAYLISIGEWSSKNNNFADVNVLKSKEYDLGRNFQGSYLELFQGLYLLDREQFPVWARQCCAGVSFSTYVAKVLEERADQGAAIIERFQSKLKTGTLPRQFLENLLALLAENRKNFGFMSEYLDPFKAVIKGAMGLEGRGGYVKGIFDSYFTDILLDPVDLLGKNVAFNLRWLKDEVIRINSRVVPDGLGPQDWNRIKTSLIMKMEANPELQEKVNEIAWGSIDGVELIKGEEKITWTTIRRGCLESPDLESMFDIRGSVSLLQLKLYYCLRYILAENEGSNPGELSGQDERLIQFAAMVLTCMSSKQDGISVCYSSLPVEMQIPSEANGNYNERERIQIKGREYVWTSYQLYLQSLFALNHPVLRELCGLAEGASMNYPVHQRREVLNTIGAQVGFEEEIELDPHFRSINVRLKMVSLEQRFKVWNKYYSVQGFLEFLIGRLNVMLNEVNSSGMPVNEGLYEAIDSLMPEDPTGEREFWEIDDAGLVSITNEGALEVGLASLIISDSV